MQGGMVTRWKKREVGEFFQRGTPITMFFPNNDSSMDIPIQGNKTNQRVFLTSDPDNNDVSNISGPMAGYKRREHCVLQGRSTHWSCCRQVTQCRVTVAPVGHMDTLNPKSHQP